MRQGWRWMKALVVLGALLGGAAGAFAWVQGAPPFHGGGWSQLVPQIPAGRRVWLLLPTGLLAMVFTARRTGARGSSF